MNKQQTVCFSGYRPEKFPFPLEAGCEAYIKLQADITRGIMESVRVGYTRFLSGMARGFDLIASGILLEMKGMFPVYAGVKLVAVLPFLGHGFHGRWGDVHDMILEEAGEVLILPLPRGRRACLDRNRYMVARSSRLLCYYDGQPGGTAHTVRCAVHNGLEVYNLADYDILTDPSLGFTDQEARNHCGGRNSLMKH